MNCYILTGGRSTRMGRSKTELFFDRVLAAAAPAFDEVIAVQRADGDALPVRTLFEPPHKDEGPLFGVLRALEDSDARCFILAVDYPLMTSELLGRLRARIESAQAPLVVPVCNGRPQPLCAGYSPALIPMIRRRISSGRLDLMGLIGEAGGETFPLDVPELTNVNSPEELEETERLR